MEKKDIMWDLKGVTTRVMEIYFFLKVKHKITLVYRQEMTSKVPPLRAGCKMSCWLPYNQPARKAHTFNWPSIRSEGHPPIYRCS